MCHSHCPGPGVKASSMPPGSSHLVQKSIPQSHSTALPPPEHPPLTLPRPSGLATSSEKPSTSTLLPLPSPPLPLSFCGHTLLCSGITPAGLGDLTGCWGSNTEQCASASPPALCSPSSRPRNSPQELTLQLPVSGRVRALLRVGVPSNGPQREQLGHSTSLSMGGFSPAVPVPGHALGQQGLSARLQRPEAPTVKRVPRPGVRGSGQCSAMRCPPLALH